MCNAMQCTEPYGHRTMHQAVHQQIPGVPSTYVRVFWDDMWIDTDLQALAKTYVLELPGERA